MLSSRIFVLDGGGGYPLGWLWESWERSGPQWIRQPLRHLYGHSVARSSDRAMPGMTRRGGSGTEASTDGRH